MVPACSQRRGAMNSQNSPSPSSMFLTWATPFMVAVASRSAGTTSSSWNCTPSKPRFLYSRIFWANSTSRRTGGPNGSAPVLMFQGPNVKRYFFMGVGSSLLARDVQTVNVLAIAQIQALLGDGRHRAVLAEQAADAGLFFVFHRAGPDENEVALFGGDEQVAVGERDRPL